MQGRSKYLKAMEIIHIVENIWVDFPEFEKEIETFRDACSKER